MSCVGMVHQCAKPTGVIDIGTPEGILHALHLAQGVTGRCKVTPRVR